MKQIRKILAVVISLAIVVAAIPTMYLRTEIKAADSFVITSPEEGKLVAAGHFDIKWSEATDKEVKNYTVYLNDKAAGTTESTFLDCYTTKVDKHTAYVVAKYTDGTESTTPVTEFYVTKKGLAVNDNMGKNIDPLYMNMGWYYTWGTNPFSYTTYKYAEFVPMKWGAGDEDRVLGEIAKKNYMYLLPYNEPDYPQYDQWGNYLGGSNVKVETAINNWSKFIGKSRYLGTPAPAQSPSWDGGTWMREFMNGVDHDTIDFIPLHCYYGTYGGAAGANSFLKEVVDKTWEMYHKPIWITEFGVSGWGYSNASARKQLAEFMYTVIDGLNEREYVERYSWFSFDTTDERNGASALWTNATGVLTELGQIYSFYGNPEGYVPPTPETPNYTFTSGTRNTAYTNSITINGINCDNYINADSVSVTASSENGNHTAEKAIDGDVQNESRWESKHNVDPQTFTVNLGEVRKIKRLNICWENAGAKDYNIEVSTDGNTWTNIADIEGAGSNMRRDDTITLKNLVSAQYVKITGTARTTNYGYSIWELAVYGTDDSKVDETEPVETTTRPVITKPDIPTEPPKPSMPTETETTKPAEEIPINTTQGSDDINKTTEETVPVKLAKTKVKKATKKKAAKKVKVTLKRIKGAKKYQVQISNTKRFKKKLVKKTVKKVRFTLSHKKIKNKRKLYIRARAMRAEGKKRYYGRWSRAKKIKILK